MTGDPRLDTARAMPMAEILDRLPLADLRRVGAERIGPCPQCGGRDRFGVHPGRGVFYCRGCQAKGDGLALVQHVMGLDFKGALAFLCGDAEDLTPRQRAEAREEAEARRREEAAREARRREAAVKAARRIWKEALISPPRFSAIQGYLHARGCAPGSDLAWPPAIGWIADHPYRRGRGPVLHRGPAMICAIQGPSGALQAVHQTWIDPDRPGHKARIFDPETGAVQPAKLVRGVKKGGAIRLGRHLATKGQRPDHLIMGEGVETTLSAKAALPHVAAEFWAGVDLGNMAGRSQPGSPHLPDPSDAEAFYPPAWVAELTYLQDGDSDPVRTRAALECGLARARARGMRATLLAAPPGKDFNDLMRGPNDG